MYAAPSQNPSASPSDHRSTATLFREVAARDGARAAVRHGDTELSYAELALAAGGLARRLRAQGIGRGDVVATVVDRSVWSVVSVLGAWAVGAAPVHLEPTDPESRIAALLTATGARAVLTDAHNRPRLAERTAPVLLLDASLPTAPYEPDEEADPQDTAYLVFTSGSTGVPKAVDVPHRAVLNHHFAFWRYMDGITTADSFGLTTTFAADLGLISVFGALLSGARLDIYDRSTTLDAEALATELKNHPVDALTYTPSLLEALAGQRDIRTLLPGRMVIVAGEAFPPRLAAALLEARPDLQVFNAYGPSEATIEMMLHQVTEPDTHRSRIPVGKAIDGVELRLLGDDGAPVPDGTPGNLHIGGVCLAHGYLGDQALTERKFTRDATGERLYRTDDLMIRDSDGIYAYLGRADRQLKVRGNRVEPDEIESALLALDTVRQALVVGESPAPDAPTELVAYVVTAGPVEPAELSRQLGTTLARALVPSRIVPVPAIPVTVNGKADLAALRAMASDGGASAGPVAHPPRTGTEQFVADLWCAALGRSEVGRDERFMEIGGDSFKALRVFAGLRRRHPDLTIGQLFAHPTVAALAAALDAADPARTGRSTATVEL
ncbi:non-ribosomal peptide synthetase [Streptomyces sp. NPDC014733]|uniref:non-ribosomal peptide synthetase n=1 Tax=Streptomyces sp. NPDC014733 TaxID=3364885 RepID=UPI0036F78F35